MVSKLSPERKLCLTATDMTILMGTVPPEWGTPRTVWMDKLGLSVPKKPSLAMSLGSHLEDYLMDTADIPKECRQVFARHKELPLGATADAVIGSGAERMGIEIKTTTSDEEWGESVPPRVMVQCHTGMMAHGINRWKVDALIMTRDVKDELVRRIMDGEMKDRMFEDLNLDRRIYEIIYNPKLASDIADTAITFWDGYVVPQIQPDDGQASCKLPPLSAELPMLYDTGSAMDCLGERIAKLDAWIKELEVSKKDMLSQFMDKVGSSKKVEGSSWTLSRSLVKGKPKLDSDRLVEFLLSGIQSEQRDRLVQAYTVGGADFYRNSWKLKEVN